MNIQYLFFLFYLKVLHRIIEIIMEEVLQKIENKPKKNARLGTANPLYSVQKLLRSTISINRFKSNHIPRNPDLVHIANRTKCFPSIVALMHRNKASLQASLTKNHTKLNSSFSGYFRSEMDLLSHELQKKKITKLKKAEEKGQKMTETPPVERDDGYMDLNLKMTPLPNRCFDSLFPAIRYNATLFSNDKQVYLLGGYHQQGFEELGLFHKYDHQGRKWVQVHGQGESPKLSPCFHTVEIYRNNMVIVGGVSFEGEKGKRFNTELLIYNLERNEWLRARGGVSLKHHASTLFGSTLIISGGINEKERYSQDLYFVTFTGGNLLNPLIFTVHNHADVNEKLAHHKIVHTYQLEPNVRNHVRMDGVFSFGGEDENGQLNNDLMFINVLGKAGQNLDIKFKRWELVVTNQDKPCPRKDHSFSIINKKGIAVLAGGIEQYGNWLTDIWLFDFVRLYWININTQPRIEESIGTLAGHCACTMGSIVYLYNGNVEKKREKAFWALETDSSNLKAKKTIFSTKLPTFKSIHSDKENFSLAQI